VFKLDEPVGDELAKKVEPNVHEFGPETVVQHLAARKIDSSAIIHADWDLVGDVANAKLQDETGHPG
jgi:hypothetical protein